MKFENMSRRSFLKKTTVLTVGISSATLFTGLVSASSADYCAPQKVPVYENGVFSYHKCYFEGSNDSCGSNTSACGMALEPDPITQTATYAIINCNMNKTDATSVKCKPIPGDTPV